MIPDTGVRALPDELVDRMFAAPQRAPWLEPLAELVAEKLEPLIRAEICAALETEREQAE